ncbi:MAG: hypothetical protein JWN48_5943 [Myxococcaceae bacterium]|nr:hypothetical protein [Myxococcaceae bacterium]
MQPSFKRGNGRLLLGLVLVLVPTGIMLAMAYERRWLDDDGFINLRIVRNLLHGNGPVFNLDERVEAGTSPLWLGVLALLGALGARLEDASVYTGIALAGLAVLLAQDAASRLHAAPGSSLRERLQRGFLPLGVLTVAVEPGFWDYASSGLETSLGLAWLAAGYDVLLAELRGPPRASSLRRQLGTALLLGLGILIRPELSLYALGFFALYLAALTRDRGRRGWLHSLYLAGVFAALPVAYQVFRMGYYSALSPNTAIAKEAFLANWRQGGCYLQNFLEPYALLVPLLALGLLFVYLASVLLRARGPAGPTGSPPEPGEPPTRPARLQQRLQLASFALPTLIGLVHALYVVRMGGDYMHARMLLPALFALLLPLAVVPLKPDATRLGLGLTSACAAVVLAWAVLCASSLRVAAGNQCDIGDERGWYAREAQVENPVRLEAYEKHPFHRGGRDLLDTLRASCPDFALAVEGSDMPGCRLLHLQNEEARQLYPSRLSFPIADSVDHRLVGMVSYGAIGITGFMLPDQVHLADPLGLADPLVARVQLAARGRPGHEKVLPVAWRLARFGAPLDAGEDASVGAARHALRCGPLAELDRALREPLTLERFASNLWLAPAHTRLRIPSDPFAAEALLCGGKPLTFLSTPGAGGYAFHFRCPSGSSLSALRGSFDPAAGAVSQLTASCAEPGPSREPPLASPAYGMPTSAPFELVCPVGSRIVGIYGSADQLVHSLGLVCAPTDGAATTRSATAGVFRGAPFELLCRDAQPARSLIGRAGWLIDAVGLACD